MDLERNLIILKNEDCTKEAQSVDKIDDKVKVTFPNGKTYSYNQDRAVIYLDQSPRVISADSDVAFVDGKLVNDMVLAQIFGRHVRIFRKYSPTQVLDMNRVRFTSSALAAPETSKCFEYLKEVALECGLTNDQGTSILSRQYEGIKFVDEEHVLATFLSGKFPPAKTAKPPTPIYPFGFNSSQKMATDRALRHPLSIIEGPPGTGKTQTILNIVANIVMNGESVAVVSNNNSATDNVLDKLKKSDVGFIAAPLGKKDNKEKFIESQSTLPDLSTFEMESQKEISLRQESKALFDTLGDMLEKENSLSALRQELEALELENEHFERSVGGSRNAVPPLKSLWEIDASKAIRLWITCEEYAESNKPFGLWSRIVNFFRFGLVDDIFYAQPFGDMIFACKKHFYKQRLFELRKEISELSEILSRFSFKEKMKEYAESSMRLFRAYLCNRYSKNKREDYEMADLLKRPDSFINDYPVVLSTTHSLRSCLSKNFIYDYVIIDEASQVDLVTGALALSCARKAVIVGDSKQLPHVVDDVRQEKSDEIFQKYKLPEPYRYSSHSLLRSISELFPNLPKTQLREHYRCHPKIINFCNQKFYDNQLIILTEMDEVQKPLMVYETVKGEHARGHINQRQIDVIQKEIFIEQKLDPKKVGIVTPYRKQSEELQKTFKGAGLKAETVDKFQGQENDVIILSTVDNQITPFTDNPNRLNVAVSRAVRQLILLIHGNRKETDTNIGDLIQYIRYNNMEVIKSEINSIFDLLYKSYNEERKEYLKKRKRISKYDSENLMYGLICDVLKQEHFSKRYAVSEQIPLSELLRTLDKLDGPQKAYAENERTKVDFVIFNKLGFVPVLAVEVDGHSFHRAGSEQEKRDLMKNVILEKYGLPLIRFRTTGSGERERLETALAEI